MKIEMGPESQYGVVGLVRTGPIDIVRTSPINAHREFLAGLAGAAPGVAS
jgi:hypothetical protein